MFLLLITHHFNSHYISSGLLSEKNLLDDIGFYHKNFYKTSNRRKLAYDIDKIQIKNKKNQSRKSGGRVLSEVIEIEVEVIETEIEGKSCVVYTPGLFFDVNKEEKFNPLVKSDKFLKKESSNIKDAQRKIFKRIFVSDKDEPIEIESIEMAIEKI